MSELGDHDISDDCPVCNRQLMTAEEWAALNTEEGFDEILGDDDYPIALDDASSSSGSDDSGSVHSDDMDGDGCIKSREKRATISNGGRRGNHGRHGQHGRRGQHGQHKHLDYNRKHSVGSSTKVVMPTGKEFLMPIPATPKWKCRKYAKLYNLDPKGKGQREYKIIEQEMENTIVPINNCETVGGCFKHFKIIKIQRVVQPCAWRRYIQMKWNIQQETNGHANEHMLFHGSDAQWAIVRGGFDERYASTNGQFGAGLYFADKSSLADQFVFGYFGGNGCKAHQDKACYKCVRSILLCRVLLGNTKKQTNYENMAHAPVGKHSITATPGGGFKYPEYVVYRGEQVQRVVQPCAWRRYIQMKWNIKQETNGHANEHMLFHGSDAQWAIVRGGFDERYASTNGQFGAGLYFTDKSSLADQFVFGYFGGNGCKEHQDKACYICVRSMLLCRVLLGNTKKLTHYQNMAHTPVGKHSITATPGGGFKYPEYVVYRGEQAYPEYQITYKIVNPDAEDRPSDDAGWGQHRNDRRNDIRRRN